MSGVNLPMTEADIMQPELVEAAIGRRREFLGLDAPGGKTLEISSLETGSTGSSYVITASEGVIDPLFNIPIRGRIKTPPLEDLPGFVPFSDPEVRLACLEAEFEACRRQPIPFQIALCTVREEGGNRLRVLPLEPDRLSSDSRIGLAMVDMPGDWEFSRLLEEGELNEADVRNAVRVALSVHEDLEDTIVKQVGSREFLIALMKEEGRFLEIAALRSTSGEVEALVKGVEGRFYSWVEGNAKLVERRIQEGRVREIHADCIVDHCFRTPVGVVVVDPVRLQKAPGVWHPFHLRDEIFDMASLARGIGRRELLQGNEPDLVWVAFDEYFSSHGGNFNRKEVGQLFAIYSLYDAMVRADTTLRKRRLEIGITSWEEASFRQKADGLREALSFLDSGITIAEEFASV